VKGADGKPRLVPRVVPGAGFHTREPQPGLFREFAKMPPKRDAIQAFAAQYGDLFSRYDPMQSAVRDDGTVSFGASLGAWTREIGDMCVLVELWEQIQHKQVAALKKVIKWAGNKKVGYSIKTPRRERSVTLAHVDIPETGLSRFSPKDVVLPARCALRLEINLRLAEHPTVPQLAWTPDTPSESGGRNQRIVFTPPHLLAALWLWFARAVTSQFQLTECKACGKYFQVGPGGRRADATTCSNACRQRKKRNYSVG
jgi:hypothetical protein